MDNEIFKKGLTSKQAEKLLEQYGPNEVKETRKFTLLKSFISQFDNFLILLLIGAGLVAYFIGERIDSTFS